MILCGRSNGKREGGSSSQGEESTRDVSSLETALRDAQKKVERLVEEKKQTDEQNMTKISQLEEEKKQHRWYHLGRNLKLRFAYVLQARVPSLEYDYLFGIKTREQFWTSFNMMEPSFVGQMIVKM